MLDSIQNLDDVALKVVPRSPDRWRVTVAAADAPGALSMISGLMTAFGLDILSVDVTTHDVPSARVTRRTMSRLLSERRGPSRPRRRLLDTFEVRGAVPADLWERFRTDLRELMALLTSGKQEEARERVIERVSRAARSSPPAPDQLLPMRIETAAGRLTIRAADTMGFLFSFANALTMLGANITRAEIRTERGEVRDTFWLTDLRGAPIASPRRLRELKAAAALIKQFTHLLPRSPNPAQAIRQFAELIRDRGATRDLQSPAILGRLAELMGVSRFLWEDFLRLQHENLFPVLAGGLSARKAPARLRRELRGEPGDPIEALNRFKDREMFRIDLRHITGRIDFEAFSAELTALAEVVVAETARRIGEPAVPWAIGALGKFGGRELGFGSDLELIFVFDGPGEERFVHDFQAALSSRRQGIFEIDLRLRPYGKAGSAATQLEAFRRYYAPGGGARQFERLALVKLRPVAGDPAVGERMLEARDAFVYSGAPLDWNEIRHHRRRQAAELVEPGAVSAKYSPGGLADIEYFVQARQIEAGLRTPNTLEAIALLKAGARLRESYRLLRRLIDALRVVRGNARDLTLPPAGSREFDYLARRLKVGDPRALRRQIDAAMASARRAWKK